MERLQAENASLRERLAADTAAVEETTRRMAAEACRAQKALESRQAAETRELRADLQACAHPPARVCRGLSLSCRCRRSVPAHTHSAHGVGCVRSAREEVDALRDRLAGRETSLSSQLRDANEAHRSGLSATERAAADAAEAILGREAAEARAAAAEAAAEAAEAQAKEALSAVAGLDAGLASTWRRMETAMSDGIANAAAAAAALIADAENTLNAKLQGAQEKADSLAARCSGLEAQLATEHTASAEAARLRRAAAALLALNERLLARSLPHSPQTRSASSLGDAEPHFSPSRGAAGEACARPVREPG